MRYVRVPRGQTITFDKATQQFHIPPNTRFYKTFLKQVIDSTGQPSWRKIETRVIVSRPDENGPDGRAVKQTALYGTYVWSDDETTGEAARRSVAQRPAVRRSHRHLHDRRAEGAGHRRHEPAESAAGSFGRRPRPALRASRARALHRSATWAAPARASSSASLLCRSPDGPRTTGGLYEPAADDELSQLQRLIDYGVITGMTSPDDVLPLEQSRKARALPARPRS